MSQVEFGFQSLDNETLIENAHITSIVVFTGDDDSKFTDAVEVEANEIQRLSIKTRPDFVDKSAPFRIRGEVGVIIKFQPEGCEDEEPRQLIISHHKGTIYCEEVSL